MFGTKYDVWKRLRCLEQTAIFGTDCDGLNFDYNNIDDVQYLHSHIDYILTSQNTGKFTLNDLRACKPLSLLILEP